MPRAAGATFGGVRSIVAAAAVLLFVGGSGSAGAGNVTPAQYAYGGGSNGAAVIASRPSGPQSGSGAGAPAQTSGSPQGAPAPGASAGSAATGAGGAAAQGRLATARPQALVGIAAAPATPVASFGALNRSIPTDALWAVALAIACTLGAWLLRRGRGAG